MDEDFTDPSFLTTTVWAIIVCVSLLTRGKKDDHQKTLSPSPRLATRLDETKSKSPHLVFIGTPPGGAHDAHPPGGETKNQYFGLRLLTDSVSVDVMEALFFFSLFPPIGPVNSIGSNLNYQQKPAHTHPAPKV
jgi:hypothetical protein